MNLAYKLLDLVVTGTLFIPDDETELPAVNCNDWFYYATADAVDIQEADLPAIEQAINDVEHAMDWQRVPSASAHYGLMLFATRKRGEPPLEARREWFPEKLRPLFYERITKT